MTLTPSPGNLIRLCPERWDGQLALVIPPPPPSVSRTCTDFAGQSYIWILPSDPENLYTYQVPMSHIKEIIA